MTRPMPGPPEDCYCRFGNATCQECETRGYPYPWGLCPGCDLHNGRSDSHYKRLTDAECAAEYWRAASDFRDRLRHGLAGDDLNPEWGRRLIWHRFATRPYALEES